MVSSAILIFSFLKHIVSLGHFLSLTHSLTHSLNSSLLLPPSFAFFPPLPVLIVHIFVLPLISTSPHLITRYLGIHLGHDKKNLSEELNWNNKLEKINRLLILWSERDDHERCFLSLLKYEVTVWQALLKPSYFCNSRKHLSL